MVWAKQRLRMVGSNWCAASVGQNKTHVPRWLFQRFEQGIGRDGVHLLGRVDQHRLAAPTATGALGEFHGITHGIHANFFAGLAFFIVDLGLGLLTQRPATLQHVDLGHQHTQIRMGMHINAVAAGAVAASALLRGLLAQPRTHHGHAQLKLPHARRALQQPRMPALGQQGLALLRKPRGQQACRRAHAAAPRPAADAALLQHLGHSLPHRFTRLVRIDACKSLGSLFAAACIAGRHCREELWGCASKRSGTRAVASRCAATAAGKSNQIVKSGSRMKSGSSAHPVCAMRSSICSLFQSKPRPCSW